MPTLTQATKDFIATHLVQRQHTGAVKWDGMGQLFGRDDLLPMWVADMEFAAPQAIRDALVARVQTGVFGYSLVPDGYYEALDNWMTTRHGVHVDADWVRFDAGVVNALYHMVAWRTEPEDQVCVMQPVYYPFMKAIEDQHRQVVSVDLLQDASGWHIDFDQLEATFQKGAVKLLIMCSPHNPVGRIWTEAELTQVLTLAERYGVFVIADEIHQDFEISGPRFTSALAIDNGRFNHNLVVLNAATKTFNLAALRNAHVLIPDARLRQSYDDYAIAARPVDGSLLGQIATMTGYQAGAAWLDQLLDVIRYNHQQLQATLAAGAPEARVAALEGTYLSFVDLGAYVTGTQIEGFIQDACGLAVDFGSWFSEKTPSYIRLNLATDPALVQEAAERLVQHLQ